MIEFIQAFFIGLVMIGASTTRIHKIREGKPLEVVLLSVTVSATYLLMVNYIVHGDMVGYLGFSSGSIVVTTWLAWCNRNKEKSSG